ncbi:MAG: DUF5615 family PIN-like protein [Nitrospirae bacterium]|nr:DUF5615 family PIN-like protein [Nitrospirota bacterium]
MSLRLLADLHISPKTVSALLKNGYDISRVTDYLPPTSSDIQIIDLTERLNASILTQDLDFSALVAKSGKVSPSVISLRVSNVSPHRITSLLLTLLPMIQKELEQGAIISVDDAGVRIRLLPI